VAALTLHAGSSPWGYRFSTRHAPAGDDLIYPARVGEATWTGSEENAEDPDADDPFFNPAWYRGTRANHISDRSVLDQQTKALSRDDANRYRNFRPHLPLDSAEALAFLSSRPRHIGDTLRVRWPPNNAFGRPIHLTLHQRQFLEDGMPGTLRLHRRMGQAQLAYLAVGKGGTTVLGKFGFDPSAVKRMPKEDVKWKFGTCAVVSNSGEILRDKLGAEIDAHDAVIRINYPPIETYEEHVGSKTTIELVNHHHARMLALAESYDTRRFLDPRFHPKPQTLNPKP
jgi:hypothetical protein